MKIYTRRGDRGETDLFGGVRLSKDAPRVETYGAVDELNAFLGVAVSKSGNQDVQILVRQIQSTLFDIGAYLATPNADRREKSGVLEPQDEDALLLEEHIDAFEKELEPLRNFILPGGTQAAAAFHVARTVCRRVERRCVALNNQSPIDPATLRYLNRLSDLLFVLARLENRRAGVDDIPWRERKR